MNMITESDDTTDSNSSDDEYGLRKVLDVELPDNFDPDAIPLTGEEYVQHVMYERTNCKKWVTANKDFTKFRNNQTIHIILEDGIQTSLPKFRPPKEWQDEAIQNYIELKTYLENRNPVDGILSNLSPDFLKQVQESPPKISELAQYSQSTKMEILRLITCHLDNFDNVSGISESLGALIYGVLLLIEKPLSPDCCFIIREFAKKCASLKASFKEWVDCKVAIPLSLYICIIARYFQQLDLAE